jgi:hypothetical protein
MDRRRRHRWRDISGFERSCDDSHRSRLYLFFCITGPEPGATTSHQGTDNVACLHVSMSPRLNSHGTSRIRLCGFEPILDQQSPASKVPHSTMVTTSLYMEPPHVASTAHYPHTRVCWSERRTNRRCINFLEFTVIHVTC